MAGYFFDFILDISQIAADFFGKVIGDFAMARYCGAVIVLGIDIKRVARTLSFKPATASFNMRDKFRSLHVGTAMRNVFRST